MANGSKKVVFNTRERIISSDFNRAQDMVAEANAELLARRFNDVYQTHLPGYAAQTSLGGQTPMKADIYGGLFVKVDDPTSLFIDPGVVGVIDPDASPGLDDDPYKVINDPGLSAANVLTFLSNSAGGGRRIDLVVADVTDVVLETDLRDIYDTSTGLFTPQNVNKVVAKRLSYSIVRGTPAGGMPTIPNRIILAVASVSTTATGWNNVTFWDVRPLVSERMPQSSSKRRYYDFDFYAHSDGTHYGYIETEFNGYRAGGRLMNTSTSADAAFDCDASSQSASNAGYQDASASPNDIGLNPIVALFPNGLPRWARYSASAAPGLAIRAPYGPRGLLVGGKRKQNDHIKCDAWGKVTGMAIPSAYGLLGTSDGVLLYMAAVMPGVSTGIRVIGAHGRGRRINYQSVSQFQSVTTGSGVNNLAPSTEDDYIMNFNVGDIISGTSGSYAGVAPNMTMLYMQVKPPAVKADPGYATPNAAQYSQLGFFVMDDASNSQYGMTWGQEMVGNDGTSIPETMLSPEVALPVRHSPDDGTISMVLKMGVCRLAGSPTTEYDYMKSQWVFDGSNAHFVFRGYEV